MSGDGIPESDPSFLVEHQRRDSGNRLGHGGDIENRVPAHRIGVLHPKRSGGAMVYYAAPASHQGHESRRAPGFHHPVHPRVDSLEAFGRHAHRFGIGELEFGRG